MTDGDDQVEGMDADELAAHVRARLVAQRIFDVRRRSWKSGTDPVGDTRFIFREIRVETQPLRLSVLFEWKDEPGTLFGFEFDEDALTSDNGFGEGIEGAADNVWMFVTEETGTGIMRNGERNVREGITWIR